MSLLITMDISIKTNLNFGAIFKQPVEIAKFNKERKQGYIPVGASLVELNPKNSKDIEAVKSIVKRWGYDDEYGYCILDDLMAIKDGYINTKTDRVYAVTLQKNGFRTLDPDKIVGLAEITKRSKKSTEINFIQVEPESTFIRGSKNFINIGKSLVEYFQEKCKRQTLFVKSSYKAANFYEKMGFEITNIKELIYTFKPFLKK